MNMNNFKFIDLFCGIGGLRIPFEELGGECVFSSDWDEDAQEVYKLNFGEKPEGNIKNIKNTNIPEHDILLAGFPCQSFSIIGKRKGFADTRGTLFFEIERILDYHKPKAFLLENVKNLKSHDKGRTLQVILNRLENMGYYVYWDILNALDFGLPQKRERTFIIGFDENFSFKFPQGLNFKKDLKDILQNDNEIPEKYFGTDYIKNKRKKQTKSKRKFYPSIWHENRSGNVSINNFACALRASASHSYQLVNGKRRFTPRELLRLQGFPEDFQIIGNETTVRKLTGNSVPVPVVREIAKEMIQSMETEEKRMIQQKLKLNI